MVLEQIATKEYFSCTVDFNQKNLKKYKLLINIIILYKYIYNKFNCD